MRNTILTIVAVLTLIGCSPEEQTGYEQSISSILTSETSWLSEPIDDGDGGFKWGFTFRSNDYGSLDFSSLFQQMYYSECLQRSTLEGNPTIEVYNDRVVMTFEDNNLLTFIIEDNLLKIVASEGDIFFIPDSVTLLCESW